MLNISYCASPVILCIIVWMSDHANKFAVALFSASLQWFRGVVRQHGKKATNFLVTCGRTYSFVPGTIFLGKNVAESACLQPQTRHGAPLPHQLSIASYGAVQLDLALVIIFAFQACPEGDALAHPHDQEKPTRARNTPHGQRVK